MIEIRPMSKDLLKKRFLKVLRESALDLKKYLNYKALLRFGFPKYLGIKPLSDDEYRMGLEAVEELERDNYIERVSVGAKP